MGSEGSVSEGPAPWVTGGGQPLLGRVPADPGIVLEWLQFYQFWQLGGSLSEGRGRHWAQCLSAERTIYTLEAQGLSGFRLDDCRIVMT